MQAICGYAGCEVVELNLQPDHVHLVLMIPPKVGVSNAKPVQVAQSNRFFAEKGLLFLLDQYEMKATTT